MLANAPDVDRSTTNRPLPEERSKADVADVGSLGLPVHRVGLEQEYFLVDRKGEVRDLADPFLRRCRDAARAEGLDPHCFKAECVKNLVEVATPPSSGLKDLAVNYLNNLELALKVASELGLALYPLGTYPLPISPVVREDPGYGVKASTIGHGRFSHAGRCAGAHLHLELPAGTVWPDVKAALDAPAAAQRELLGLYNLATALDPALVALTRACPYYEGRTDGFAARTVHYRGILGFEGLYQDLHVVGGLSTYASRVEDLVDQQRARYRAWFSAMDLAGVERRPMIHAKTIVADGWWSKVGSTNLNFSSLVANWEIDLVVEDTDFAEQMERLFEEDVSNSREIRLEGSGQRQRVRPDGRVDTSDSGARAGVVGSGTGSGATISRVVPTLVQKGAAPLQTHEHALAAAASGALLGVSLLGARFPRLVAWPLVAVGAFLGGLGVLRAAQSTLSESEEDRQESGAT